MIDSLRDFLDDNYQAKLRYRCQMNTERFEDTLTCYKNAFICEWNRLLAKSKSDANCNDDIVKKLFKIPVGKISNVFDKIRDIYILWIDAKNQEAHQNLKDFLEEEKKWLTDKVDIQEYIFFRARKRRKSEDFTKLDMYHIPFNKRYMVSNQRYGLTGQPLFYIGSSVLDILYELDGSLVKLNDYSVSAVKFKNSMEVIDFRNRMDAYFLYNIPVTTEIGGKREVSFDELKIALLETILVFCCSFRGRSHTVKGAFVEEYVLPQMVAQYLKLRGDKGLLYSSVKDFPCVELNRNGKIGNIQYRDNVAIFTKYDNRYRDNGNQEHDMNLYKKIAISPPVNFGKIIDNVNMNDVQELCEYLSQEQNNLGAIGLNQENMFADLMISDYDEGELHYFDSSVGRFQLYLIYQFLHHELCNLKIKG